jgi:hypothetical protein
MPYDLFERLPFVDVSRTPARFTTLAALALAVLAAYGARWAAGRLAGRVPQAATIALAALLVLGEFWTAPYPLSVPPDATVARRIGQEIAATDPAGTVLTLPYRKAEEERLYHQTLHGRPMFGGFIARDIERPFRAQTPGFADLAQSEPYEDIFAPAPDPLAVLNYYHVGYILYYRGELREEVPREDDLRETIDVALRRVLGQPGPALVSADGALEAWRTPRVEPPAAFLRAGRGWQSVEETLEAERFRWIGEAAELTVERAQAMPAMLTFVARSLGEPRRLEVRDGERVLGVYTIGEEGPTEVRLPLPAASGATRLILRSLDGVASPDEYGLPDDDRQLSVALSDVRLDTVPAAPTRPAGA